MVVDGLRDGLSLLQRLDLFEHKVEVVLKWVEGGEAGNLAAVTVVQVVIVEADDGGKVRNKRVSLPTAVSEPTAERTDNISTEDACKTTHESGLSTTGVGSDTDDDGCLSVFERHVQAGRRLGNLDVLGHERRGSKSGNRADREGSDRKTELHDCVCVCICERRACRNRC